MLYALVSHICTIFRVKIDFNFEPNRSVTANRGSNHS